MTEALLEPGVIDRAEMEILKLPPAVCPLTHVFTPGLYTRQIFIPAGVAIATRTHLVEHPFIISQGAVETATEDGGRIVFEAPAIGVTKPGTRRVLVALTDTIWTTIHPNPNNETDPDVIVREVTGDHVNPLVADKSDPRFNMWSKDVSPSLVHAPALEMKEESP